MEEESLQDIKEETLSKTFSKVFDRQTIESVHKLAVKGHFELVEFVISTGKEAHVFRAVDKSGNYKAVKIYKTDAAGFNRMESYLEGDIRFRNVKKNKRDLIFAWAKKEFKNLQLFNKAGIRVPLPIALLNNVLVMEFIGENGVAAPTLKEASLKDLKALKETLVDFLAKMVFKAELIHADLSEYNLLNKNQEIVLIDCAQAVLTSHPRAKEFFERDIRNVAQYLTKNGLRTDFGHLYTEIKAKKNSI